MRKVAVLLVFLIGLISAPAYADNGGYGPRGCRVHSPCMKSESMAKLRHETRELRRDLRDKKSELRREFCRRVPDRGRIAELRKEISCLRGSIAEKAYVARHRHVRHCGRAQCASIIGVSL